ncbi:MAG: Uma2 family endonuclease [Cyanophyceae cyanobacterium]|mgnify:CR=1 FL=1
MPITCGRLTVLPGETLIIDANWEEFNEILEELGEKRSSRIAYQNGQLHIMVPWSDHEHAKENLGDFIKALLEELDIDFCPLGSTTFKKMAVLKGVEPDNCFYIQNADAVRGKDRLDLSIDPPPDLVIEIDFRSRSYREIYAALGVPELWQYTKQGLQIKHLDRESGVYQANPRSQYFPPLDLIEVIPQYLQCSKTERRNGVMRAFRAWVREQMGDCNK